MKTARTILAILFTIILCGCSNPKEITVSDLSLIGIETFFVELPQDLRKDDTLILELIGENGVVDSKNICNDYDEAKYLKVFMNKEDPKNPIFSFVAKSFSATNRTLALGEAKVQAWPVSDTFQIGEIFIFCSVDGNTGHSQKTHGDDLGIRIAVKGR